MCKSSGTEPTGIAVKFLGYILIFCLKNVSKFQEEKDYKEQTNKKMKKKV